MWDEKILIWRFNRGNAAALHRIYQRYKNDLISLAAALLGDVNLAEDAVHNVFVAFAQKVGTFRLTGSLKSYLATCLANEARNIIRRRKYLSAVDIDQANLTASPVVAPDESIIDQEKSNKLQQCLTQLPYPQREVIILHAQHDQTFREIAQNQNESINTIQSRYRYGLEKLRTLLDGEIEP